MTTLDAIRERYAALGIDIVTTPPDGEADDDRPYDPDYDRPTYDEWRRDEDERQFAADMRHAGGRDRVRGGY
jgi:hypothetical protein